MRETSVNLRTSVAGSCNKREILEFFNYSIWRFRVIFHLVKCQVHAEGRQTIIPCDNYMYNQYRMLQEKVQPNDIHALLPSCDN